MVGTSPRDCGQFIRLVISPSKREVMDRVVVAAATRVRNGGVATCGNVIFKRIVANVGIFGSFKTNVHGVINKHSGDCRSRLAITHRGTLTRVRSHTITGNTGTVINVGVSCRMLKTSGNVLVIAYDNATIGLVSRSRCLNWGGRGECPKDGFPSAFFYSLYFFTCQFFLAQDRQFRKGNMVTNFIFPRRRYHQGALTIFFLRAKGTLHFFSNRGLFNFLQKRVTTNSVTKGPR